MQHLFANVALEKRQLSVTELLSNILTTYPKRLINKMTHVSNLSSEYTIRNLTVAARHITVFTISQFWWLFIRLHIISM